MTSISLKYYQAVADSLINDKADLDKLDVLEIKTSGNMLVAKAKNSEGSEATKTFHNGVEVKIVEMSKKNFDEVVDPTKDFQQALKDQYGTRIADLASAYAFGSKNSDNKSASKLTAENIILGIGCAEALKQSSVEQNQEIIDHINNNADTLDMKKEYFSSANAKNTLTESDRAQQRDIVKAGNLRVSSSIKEIKSGSSNLKMQDQAGDTDKNVLKDKSGAALIAAYKTNFAKAVSTPDIVGMTAVVKDHAEHPKSLPDITQLPDFVQDAVLLGRDTVIRSLESSNTDATKTIGADTFAEYIGSALAGTASDEFIKQFTSLLADMIERKVSNAYDAEGLAAQSKSQNAKPRAFTPRIENPADDYVVSADPNSSSDAKKVVSQVEMTKRHAQPPAMSEDDIAALRMSLEINAIENSHSENESKAGPPRAKSVAQISPSLDETHNEPVLSPLRENVKELLQSNEIDTATVKDQMSEVFQDWRNRDEDTRINDLPLIFSEALLMGYQSKKNDQSSQDEIAEELSLELKNFVQENDQGALPDLLGSMIARIEKIDQNRHIQRTNFLEADGEQSYVVEQDTKEHKFVFQMLDQQDGTRMHLDMLSSAEVSAQKSHHRTNAIRENAVLDVISPFDTSDLVLGEDEDDEDINPDTDTKLTAARVNDEMNENLSNVEGNTASDPASRTSKIIMDV